MNSVVFQSKRVAKLTFSEPVKQAVRQRARGKCECARNTCPHYGPCKAPGTEFHQKLATVTEGEETRACQLLCKACHQQAHASSGSLGRM
jgi:hypothetical protein